MPDVFAESDIKIFNDGSGVALFREDSSTVILLTDSLSNDYPLLFKLLSENSVCKNAVIDEIKAQGLLNIDYSYK